MYSPTFVVVLFKKLGQWYTFQARSIGGGGRGAGRGGWSPNFLSQSTFYFNLQHVHRKKWMIMEFPHVKIWSENKVMYSDIEVIGIPHYNPPTVIGFSHFRSCPFLFFLLFVKIFHHPNPTFKNYAMCTCFSCDIGTSLLYLKNRESCIS